jgi:hypothetical protein
VKSAPGALRFFPNGVTGATGVGDKRQAGGNLKAGVGLPFKSENPAGQTPAFQALVLRPLVAAI